MFEVMFSDLTFGIWASETPPRSTQPSGSFMTHYAKCRMVVKRGAKLV
jgi:hypothetical protein